MRAHALFLKRGTNVPQKATAMVQRNLRGVLEQLLQTGEQQPAVRDADLLERYGTQRDPVAFELLVWRYQRLVFGVCRRILQDLHDAEDAFQATFLILARKASSIKQPATLAAWLQRVATHTALAARAGQARQREREQPLCGNEVAGQPGAEVLVEQQQIQSIIDSEVSRLPERFQAAVVLCYFEGKTVDEAARQLRCPRGSVASRLARARERLRVRLTQRGIAVTTAAVTAGLERASSARAAADGLIHRLSQVVAVNGGDPVPVLSNRVVALTREVLRRMFLRTVAVGAGFVLAGFLALTGGLVLFSHAQDDPAPVLASVDPPQADSEKGVAVTVCKPRQREVASFVDFTGSLKELKARANRAAVLPPDPIAVEFRMDEHSYLRYQRLLADKKVKGTGDPIGVGLATDEGFPRQGVLDHFDNAFSPQTGTIGVHAAVSNTGGLLLPGMFVRVRLTFGPPRTVLEVPETALERKDGQVSLWVLGARNSAEQRVVETGNPDGELRIIEAGLRPEDLVIVTGTKGLKPGTRVEPQLLTPTPEGKKQDKPGSL